MRAEAETGRGSGSGSGRRGARARVAGPSRSCKAGGRLSWAVVPGGAQPPDLFGTGPPSFVLLRAAKLRKPNRSSAAALGGLRPGWPAPPRRLGGRVQSSFTQSGPHGHLPPY